MTSERDVRAQRDVLLADMMVDALVTSALNPYWLWGSVGAPPAYCRYLGPAPLTLLDWFRNVGGKLLPPSVNRGLGLKFEAASAAAPPRGLSPAGAEARGRAAAQLRRRNQRFLLSYRFITPGARVSRPRRTKPMAPACSPDEMSPYVATFALISDFSTVARHPPSRLHGGGTVWTGVTGTSYMRCGAAGTQAAAGCCRHQQPA